MQRTIREAVTYVTRVLSRDQDGRVLRTPVTAGFHAEDMRLTHGLDMVGMHVVYGHAALRV
jgi:hypothetical protein